MNDQDTGARDALDSYRQEAGSPTVNCGCGTSKWVA
jgi:hypothetical protein